MGIKSSQLLETLSPEELDGELMGAIVEDVKRMEAIELRHNEPLFVLVNDKKDEDRIKAIIAHARSGGAVWTPSEVRGEVKAELDVFPQHCHWGILELQSYRWWVSTDVWSLRINDSVFRFPSKEAAKKHIASRQWDFDVVPWAFPARRDETRES